MHASYYSEVLSECAKKSGGLETGTIAGSPYAVLRELQIGDKQRHPKAITYHNFK